LIHLTVPARHQSVAGPSERRSAISLGRCRSKPRPCPGTPCQPRRRNPSSAIGNWDELSGTRDWYLCRFLREEVGAFHEILVTVRPQVGEAPVIQINQSIVVGLDGGSNVQYANAVGSHCEPVSSNRDELPLDLWPVNPAACHVYVESQMDYEVWKKVYFNLVNSSLALSLK